jgi:hypothetical protein
MLFSSKAELNINQNLPKWISIEHVQRYKITPTTTLAPDAPTPPSKRQHQLHKPEPS